MIKTLIILLIRFYQLTMSPLLGNSCRFTPTCSQYAIEVLRKYGIGKGCWLTLKRICKCNPWHPGGKDLP